MREEEQINPAHGAVRGILRVVGPLLAAAGALCIAVALIDFLSGFGTIGGPPKRFGLFFLGIPLFALGAALSQFAFLGALLRYKAGEAAPVAKDAFNYMAEGTRPGVATLADALGSGLRGGTGLPAERSCPACDTQNRADARYCSQCGAPLAQALYCATCGTENESDARFCNHCGEAIS